MNEDEKLKKEEETVQVPLKDITAIQERMANLEREVEEGKAKNAGLEEMFGTIKGAETESQEKLRGKKTYEPKFRVARVRKFPIAGDSNNLGYVVGWTNKGAYQEVDRTGVTATIVDFIDVIFLGQEKTPEGKIKAEKVRLLDLMNKSEQVYCKILEMKREDKPVPTGEEINITTWDPQHGLVQTGEMIDGYVVYSDIQVKVQVPGIKEEVWIDAKFLN